MKAKWICLSRDLARSEVPIVMDSWISHHKISLSADRAEQSTCKAKGYLIDHISNDTSHPCHTLLCLIRYVERLYII